MYVSLGRWDEVNYPRKMMIMRQVTSDPGSSWVEERKDFWISFPDPVNLKNTINVLIDYDSYHPYHISSSSLDKKTWSHS